jgi:diguanylate cyclase (GGDEF)-like protein
VDILARYGGEELAIILPETDLRRAAIQAERIRAAVDAHTYSSQEEDPERGLTVSIGVASVAREMRTVEDLVHEADQALYRAKTGGRNRLELAPVGNTPSGPA